MIKIKLQIGQVNISKADYSVLALTGKLYSTLKRSTKSNSKFPSLNDYTKSERQSLVKRLERERFQGKDGQIVSLHAERSNRISTIVFCGWDESILKDQDVYTISHKYRTFAATLLNKIKSISTKKIFLDLQALGLEQGVYFEAFLEGLILAQYEFDRYSNTTKKKSGPVPEIILCSKKALDENILKRAEVVSESVFLARDLINLSPRDLTTRRLVQECRQVAKKSKISCKVYDQAALKRMRAGLILAVGQGSLEPPALVVLSIKPRKPKSKKVIALVGKGITFDSGGYSIKPGSGMMTMKSDMSGAACVLGAMEALSHLKPGCEVRAYIPIAENMINGEAMRPGDVVRGLSGKTVEILNTDAEGRLILADALALAVKEKVTEIIDVATLTGACSAALGDDFAGILSDQDAMVSSLIALGEETGERLWRLPLASEYKSQLKSSVADLKNIGSGKAGATTAALFLQEFVGKTKWAHLDIAGTAFSDSDKSYIKKGGVGFGVRLLTKYVLQSA